MRISAFLTAIFASSLVAVAAQAGSNTTFVANNGTNSGACSAASPCRTVQYALGQTNTNGTVVALNGGDFGSVVITRNVKLAGTEGAILSRTTAGNIVEIKPTASKAEITNFTLEGGYAAALIDGIHANSGGLTVKNCLIRNMKGNGIELSIASSGKVSLIEDTTIESSGLSGISLTNSGAGLQLVTINRVNVENAGSDGISIYPGMAVRINDSSFTNAARHGVFVYGNTKAIASISHSSSTGNGQYGMDVELDGIGQSAGDNAFLANGLAPTHGAISTIPLK